jgi:NADH dehydrogenase
LFALSAKKRRAAAAARVERIVHVSITNPSIDSPFEYFRGKAEIESALVESGIEHSILRPAVLFGDEDILVNNIAWALRRLPVFGVFGDGGYGLQPIHVDDLADLAVAAGARTGHEVVQAIGPETFTYRELVREIAEALGLRRAIVGVPPRVGYAMGWCIGRMVGDVMITWEEVGGLMAGLLAVDAPPAGTTRLSEWARTHRGRLGRAYANELAQRV